MVFLSSDRQGAGLLARFARRDLAPNRFDIIALVLIGAFAVTVANAPRPQGLTPHADKPIPPSCVQGLTLVQAQSTGNPNPDAKR